MVTFWKNEISELLKTAKLAPAQGGGNRTIYRIEHNGASWY